MNKNRTKKIISLGLIFILIFVIFTPAVNSMFRFNLNKTSIKKDDLKLMDSENIFSYENVNWWNYDWMYRKKITVNHNFVDDGLKNFPILVNIIDSDLCNDAQNDGDDIVFTKWDSQTKFNHEIELFNGNTGELVTWVNITRVNSSTDTDFYMYYGNPTCNNQQNVENTWNSGFKVVQHLNEGWSTSPGHFKDSTVNNYDGTLTDVDGDSSSDNGIAGSAFRFNGDADFINIGVISHDQPITYSCWLKADIIDQSGCAFGRYYNGYYLGTSTYNSGSLRQQIYVNNNWNCYSMMSGVSSDVWYLLTVTYDGSTIRYYTNGVEFENQVLVGSLSSTLTSWHIGDNGNNGWFFDGVVDEVRVANYCFSGDWIETYYNNVNYSSDFYNIGTEETTPSGDEIPPVTTHELDPEAPNGENGWYVSNVFILFNVEDTQSDIAWTKYSLDNGKTWENHTGPWPFGVNVGEGEYRLLFYSSDVEGNIESTKGPFEFKVDKTLPKKWFYSFCALFGPLLLAVINIGLVKDDFSGLDRVDFYLNEMFHHQIELSSWPKSIWRFIFWFHFEPQMNDNCTGIVYDKAGNWIDL